MDIELNETELALLSEADKDITIAVAAKKHILDMIYRARRLEGGYTLSPDGAKLIAAQDAGTL